MSESLLFEGTKKERLFIKGLELKIICPSCGKQMEKRSTTISYDSNHEVDKKYICTNKKCLFWGIERYL